MNDAGRLMDATVDWCEYNFAVTEHIAEFWNTISSLPMIIMGIAGIYFSRKYAILNKRFSFAFICLAAVGFGSAMFHGTLQRRWQLMDEAPMLLVNHVLVFCLLHTDPEKDHDIVFSSIILAVSFSLEVFIYVYLHWYWVFVVGWIVGVGAQFYLGVPRMRQMSPSGWRLTVLTMTLLAIGLTLWLSEHALCRHVQFLQFHSIWHLLAGYGSFCWILALIVFRAEAMSLSAETRSIGGAPLYVVVHSPKSE